MYGFRNFQLNMTHFADLGDHFNDLRAGGMKGIVILVSDIFGCCHLCLMKQK